MSASVEDRGALISALRNWIERLESSGSVEPPPLLAELLQRQDDAFYRQVAELTRRLHAAVVELRLDDRLARIAGDAMPDARQRLRHVVQMTEEAAHRTLDLVEQMRGVTQQIGRNAATLDAGDLRRAALLRDADLLRERLNELAIAQEYQDLTGQIIKRIIALVEDVEGALLELLGGRAADLKTAAPLPIPEGQAVLAGPAVPGHVTTSQQDADALLASLGV